MIQNVRKQSSQMSQREDKPVELEAVTFSSPLNDNEAEAHTSEPPGDEGGRCGKMEKKHKVIAVVVITTIVAVVAIVVAGIQSVDYYDLAMLRRKTTGTIDTKRVYTSERFLSGPDYGLIKFPATAQTVEMKNVVAVSKNNQHITLVIRFQYFIRKEELGKLYENHKVSYHHVIVKTATDSIKDTTTNFLVDEFINSRENISRAFFMALRWKLEGKCCLEKCKEMRNGCLPGCNTTNCTDADRGLFIEVRYFQLGDVDLNTLVMDKKLSTLILTEDEERKELEQDAELVRKETERIVRKLKDKANEVKEVSLAKASVIKEGADARYVSTIETARSAGLKRFYTAVNISDEATKNSFDYIRTIQKSKHISLAVGFTQYITGNFPPT